MRGQTITEEMFLLLPTVPKPIFWGMRMISYETEERAAQIRAKDRNAKGGAIEGSEFSQETVGKSSEKTKNKGFKPAPDITGLNKEHHRDVVWRPVSPWSKRRWRFKRTNHPWFKNDKMKIRLQLDI